MDLSPLISQLIDYGTRNLTAAWPDGFRNAPLSLGIHLWRGVYLTAAASTGQNTGSWDKLIRGSNKLSMI